MFDDFHTFAAYFGLDIPKSKIGFPLHVPCSTEPNRLRAIQAMTKVELRGMIGERIPFYRSLDLLSATRLIRAGLGCLTCLVSLALNLRIDDDNDTRESWMIDDCMFSKPTSLSNLLIVVQDLRWIWGEEEAIQPIQEISWGSDGEETAQQIREPPPGVSEEEQMRRIAFQMKNFVLAKALIYRILRQDGFSDTRESLWRSFETTTPTSFQTKELDEGPTARVRQAE